MKKTMKLASFIFALTLAVSVVLTGCGNGRKDSTTKGTTENNNASNTTEDNLLHLQRHHRLRLPHHVWL